jgi:membrane protein
LPDIVLPLTFVFEFLFSLGVITLVFALMFKVLPDVKITWHDTWIGALITAIFFVIGKFAIGLYFGQSDPGSVYGVAGSVVLIMLWVFYSCLIVFFGAEFTQVFARNYGSGIRPTSKAHRVEKQPPFKKNKGKEAVSSSSSS